MAVTKSDIQESSAKQRSDTVRYSIAMVTNELGLAGMAATITSMLRHCSQPEKLHIHLFCSNLEARHKRHVSQLLKQERFAGTLTFYEFDAPALFRDYRSLHGDYTTYGKSLIPDILPDRLVLYLDTDLIVQTDVAEIFETLERGHAISAVSTGPVKDANDRHLLIDKLGIDPETPHFNAGVMLFDTGLYLKQGLSESWDTIGGDFPESLLSADQTLFNAIARGRFGKLKLRYNRYWFPGEKFRYGDPRNKIVHFVGSPKPWDFLGRFMHPGHSLWARYTSAWWRHLYCGPTPRVLHRTWKIRKSLLRLMSKGLKHHEPPIPK